MPNRSTRHYWRASFVIGFAIWVLASLELSARRGWDFSGYLLNKTVASTAILLITASFLVSVGRSLWGWFGKQAGHAKYLGLTGFGLSIVHVVLSLVVHDPEEAGQVKFAFPDYFLSEWPSMAASIVALGIFINSARLTRQSARYGTPQKARVWRAGLRLGYIGVVLILIHVVLLKQAGWVEWFTTWSPLLPPLSLLVGVLIVLGIGLKSWQLIRKKRLFFD